MTQAHPDKGEDLLDAPVIWLGDCRRVMGQWPDESIDLLVSSPPYNIGKDYEKGDWATFDAYLKDMKKVVALIAEKVKQGGSVCWQVGSHIRNGEVFPLDVLFFDMFRRKGFKLRNRIVWQFNFGLHAQRRLSGRYEMLLWFTKGDDYKFNLDPIRVPQMYPGKRHASGKGDRAGLPSGNPAGKNPSDYWTFSARQFFEDEAVWQLPNVKANHPEKTEHPCQFPVELVERCVLAFTDRGDTVADPFVGTGTTLVAAAKHGRQAWGVDRDPRYVEIAKQRLALLAEGHLPMRQSGKRVREPDPSERVAKVPEEWLRAAE